MSQFEAFADSRQSCPFWEPRQSSHPLMLRYSGGRARFFLPTMVGMNGGISSQNLPEYFTFISSHSLFWHLVGLCLSMQYLLKLPLSDVSDPKQALKLSISK